MKKTALIFLILILPFITKAQTKLAVINSSKPTVTIRDGYFLGLNTWHLDPKAKPDIYYTNIPRKNNKVTFTTDRDSISFDTHYGQTYDFIILLNGKDSCYTRISANYNQPVSPASYINKPIHIPFTMRGSRIYFNGTLNGHPNIAIQFDLGAGTSVINKNSVSKTGVKFDGKTTVSNTSGINEAPTSSNNTIDLSDLKWEHVSLTQVENMDKNEDLIIGNSIFDDKIIQVDYDRKIMTIYNEMPAVPPGYQGLPVFFEQHRPKIQTTVTVAGKKYTDWFLFDTGRDGTMLIGEDFAGKFDLWNKFRTILSLGNKKIIWLPEVSLGPLTFRDIVTNAANPAKPAGRPSLLGNELLNHFNFILDNQQGVIYLKPNSLQGNSYSNWTEFRSTLIGSVALALIIIIAIVILLRKRRLSSLKLKPYQEI